jgi:hypothetical protein
LDRSVIYPGEQGRSTDILFAQRSSLIALSKLSEALFGTGTFVTGLTVGPNTPAALNVIVQPGQIFMEELVDATAYGILPADTVHSILKQGMLMDALTVNCAAPVTVGYSVNYLIEATYQDQDTTNVVLPYFNSANPLQPLSGQNNSGAAQATERQGAIVITAKAGAAATTGTQTTPALDAGNVGLAVVTVANGQTTIVSGNISAYAGAPALPSSGVVVGGFQNNYFSAASAGGTSDAITAEFTPAPTSLNIGVPSFMVRASSANATTTPTFTPNSGVIAAHTIVKGNNLPLVAGDIAGAGHWIELQWDATLSAWVLLNPATGISAPVNTFTKADPTTVAFIKTAGTGTQALSIKAGTYISVNGVGVTFATATAVALPTLTAGTDYAIYACQDGTCRADSSFTNPIGYTTVNSRMIGGFHCGLVASGATVASGSFATAGNGMIWVQSNVDDIAGINKYSLWDLKFRAASGNNNGMVLVGGRTWVDIYLCSTDTAANGTSKYNTNIASGTVLPKIPAAFGGNGTTTYPTLNWWVANEIARANQKRLPFAHEFFDAAFGVTENQSIDATASTYPTTLRNAGYTSKYGIEEATGHQQIWGQDSNFYSEVASPAGSWHDFNGNNGAGTGRGQDYTYGIYGITRVMLGGCRTLGVHSGSRSAGFTNPPSSSIWSLSLRAVCDHLISA